ncbi:MAG: hypothetical protein V9E81_09495 [Marmoricola sp.]
MIKTSRALVVAAATSVLALTSGAAYAQSYSHVDAAGDMYDDAGVVVPTATNGDVTNISVDYTKKSLTATMTFTDLDATGSNEAGGGIVVINPRTKKCLPCYHCRRLGWRRPLLYPLQGQGWLQEDGDLGRHHALTL